MLRLFVEEDSILRVAIPISVGFLGAVVGCVLGAEILLTESHRRIPIRLHVVVSAADERRINCAGDLLAEHDRGMRRVALVEGVRVLDDYALKLSVARVGGKALAIAVLDEERSADFGPEGSKWTGSVRRCGQPEG